MSDIPIPSYSAIPVATAETPAIKAKGSTPIKMGNTALLPAINSDRGVDMLRIIDLDEDYAMY